MSAHLLTHANTVISNSAINHAFLNLAIQRQRNTRWVMVEGITQEVFIHSSKLCWVSINHRQICWNSIEQRYLIFHHQGFEIFDQNLH
jgi:hypothetical protein